MMPPLPSSSSTPWFLPYWYVPSGNATYTKLVTPLGTVHLSASIFRDELWNVLIAMIVVSATIGAWRVLTTKKPTAPASPASSGASSTTVPAPQERSAAASALDESIQNKGANSYYYAHQPRHARDATTTASDDLKKTMVSTYSWTDSKKAVHIYLTDDAVKSEQLKLNWTPTSLSMDLVVDADNKIAKSLVIPTLFGEVTDVSAKIKNNQLILTLHKKAPTPWTSLNGAAKNLEDHIEYDESLYE